MGKPESPEIIMWVANPPPASSFTSSWQWREFFSDRHRRFYYYNETTEETVWSMPDDFQPAYDIAGGSVV